jgi:hypothetical protein
MTMIESEAFQAMLAHHRNLADGVTQRVGAVLRTVEAGSGYEPAVGELVAYLGWEVLPHAIAEEHSIYQAARARADLDEVVARMVDEHRHLATSVEHLATAGTGVDAAAVAEAIGSLFAGHVAKENELILPPLVLVNDHDPKPLRYQFEAQHGGEYTWGYLQAGPERWRVRIGTAATSR